MKTLLSFAILCSIAIGTAQAQVIIANSTLKVDAVSKSDLLDIFTGASNHFKDGSRAVPVTMKGGPVHEAFLKDYIGKKENLFRGGWRGLVFAGQATMPQAFDSDAEVIKYVASVPGAIGYVGAEPGNDKVKVLTVK